VSASQVVSLGGGNFAVLADHTYAAPGNYTLSIAVGDIGAARVVGKRKISVTYP
jgi:hypothetical protein